MVNIIKKEEVKDEKKVGKAIQCKQCDYMVEAPNLQSAMLKMAFHKRLFKHMPGSVRTFDIFE